MLLRCVDLSEKHNSRLVHLQAVGLLAKTMNELDQFQEAYRILSAIMPYIIETKDIHLAASCYLTLAESLMSLKDGNLANLNRAREFIVIARQSFHSMEDKQGELTCLARLAFILNQCNDTQGRDAAAREFCKLEKSSAFA